MARKRNLASEALAGIEDAVAYLDGDRSRVRVTVVAAHRADKETREADGRDIRRDAKKAGDERT